MNLSVIILYRMSLAPPLALFPEDTQGRHKRQAEQMRIMKASLNQITSCFFFFILSTSVKASFSFKTYSFPAMIICFFFFQVQPMVYESVRDHPRVEILTSLDNVL